MHSGTFYLDVVLKPGAPFPLLDNHEDRGVYVTDGSIEVSGDIFEAGRMMVFRPGDRISVKAGPQGARLMALGGATLNENAISGGISYRPQRIALSRPKRTGRPLTGPKAPSGCRRAMTPNSSRSPPSWTEPAPRISAQVHKINGPPPSSPSGWVAGPCQRHPRYRQTRRRSCISRDITAHPLVTTGIAPVDQQPLLLR